VARDAEPAVAIVTGAAGRIGAAVVGRLEREGFRVAGVDLRPSPGALSLVADVADRSQMAAAVAQVVERLGSVSVLVTAAGDHAAAPFGSMDDTTWSRLLHVHLGGTGNACAAVLPAMLEAGHGTVVTLSTREAVDGAAGQAYRAAATGAVLAFTKSLAVEVAPRGVRVNCVAGGSPAAVADAVAFLVQDGGFYVGQVFVPAGEAVS
jgi:NAD(P)-dependent dehydrogenase (short-subunit alcohol dehydrogenase family)